MTTSSISPISSMIFPDQFDPYQMYLAPEVYKKADTAFHTCSYRFDSLNQQDQRCSIAATNSICRLINEHLCFPLRDITDYSHMEGVPDSSTVLKVQEVILQFFPLYPISFQQEEKNRLRFETLLRTINILETYYQPEVQFLNKCIQRLNLCPEYDAVDMVLADIPGNVANTIAIEVNRQLEPPNSANVYDAPLLRMITESLPAGHKIIFNSTAACVVGANSDDEAEATVIDALSKIPIPLIPRRILEILLLTKQVEARPIAGEHRCAALCTLL